jgi:hypothetical protein
MLLFPQTVASGAVERLSRSPMHSACSAEHKMGVQSRGRAVLFGFAIGIDCYSFYLTAY